jgi:hypothetical protein
LSNGSEVIDNNCLRTSVKQVNMRWTKAMSGKVNNFVSIGRKTIASRNSVASFDALAELMLCQCHPQRG